MGECPVRPPLLRATKFKLVINLQTANTIGIATRAGAVNASPRWTTCSSK
jgi:hypothetical protein